MHIDIKILSKIVANQTQQSIKVSYIMNEWDAFQRCKDSSLFANQSI